MRDADSSIDVGVLVMAYGTPTTTDDIEAYYTHIRRGNAPTPELLAELTGRYEAIGGTSPLLELTRAQAAGLAAALGAGYAVELGMKHAPPFIEDGVAALAGKGVSKIVGLVLAPHYSRMSVGQYEARAAAAAAETGVELDMVRSWHLAPGYLDLLATFVVDAVDSLKLPRPDVEVLFTAHSLPDHVLMDGEDPYVDQLRETAVMVAARARVQRWSVAWQSAGRTSEPWIGPTSSPSSRRSSSTAPGAWSSAPPASRPTTWRSSTTSTSRPSSRPTASASPLPARPCRTTTLT